MTNSTEIHQFVFKNLPIYERAFRGIVKVSTYLCFLQNFSAKCLVFVPWKKNFIEVK